ncbi:MAG: OstA-like protein [Bacteroidales bacterium]
MRVFKRFTVLCLFLSAQVLCTQSLLAQKKIKFESARSLQNLKIGEKEYIRYIGDARFFYENTRMLCDSAYLDPKENSFDAYGHVVIIKDGTKIYGDKLHFEGKISQGVLTGREVKLVDEDATLVTDKLYFNSKTSYAYYTTGGVLTSKDSRLTSIRGYYDKNKSTASFAGKVELHSPDGDLYTDSLEYNSTSELAHFYGATDLYNKDNYSYCEQGWHNRKLNQSNFQKNAYILTGSQKLFGDNIFYDKLNGYARAIGNVVVVDTVNKTNVYGDKANYWDQRKEAEVTENPYVMMIDKNDTLYLRSDKLFLRTIKDARCTTSDSTYRLIKAIGAVKYFRNDVQGVCDSMIYNSFDSTLIMHVNPVMWNEANQMSADIITVHSGNKSIRQLDFEGSAFVTSKEDSIHFNQMRGKTIYARFNEGKLYKMDVFGNGQSVYYGKENDTITMVNRVECTDISIHIKENKISKIVYKSKPSSNFYPIELVDLEEVTLKGFKWREELRPTDKYSIIPRKLVLFPVEKGNPKRLITPTVELKKEADVIK